MTDCNCTCSHFDGPHDADARHPNPRACVHAEALDVERLARAIEYHNDICSGMAIPDCAASIADEYDRLSVSEAAV